MLGVCNMDLRKNFPRSPYDAMAGIVMLPRTLDKCRAYNAETLGEYHYNCPLDKPMLAFLGVTAEGFAIKVRELVTDERIELWVKEKLSVKSKEEIEKFNNQMRHSMPDDEGSKEWLESEKQKLGRNDYFSYFDNIDADEKRF